MHGERPYRSARTRATLTTTALIAYAVISLWWINTIGNQNALLDAREADGHVSDELLNQAYEKTDDAWKAWQAIYAVTAVLFIAWMFRASRNLLPLGNNSQEYSPAAAIWTWMVPLAHLILPYIVMKEIWAGSHPNRTYHPKTGSLQAPMLCAIGPWWISWISGGVLGIIGAILTGIEGSAGMLITANRLMIWSEVANIVAAGLAILIVLTITSNQEGRYRVLEKNRQHETRA